VGPAGSLAAQGPLAHGFAHDRRWTLGRVKTLIGRLCHVGYMVEGTSRLLRRHGWPAQVPVRQAALERNDEAVAVWKEQVWPDCGDGCTAAARGSWKGFTWRDYRDPITSAQPW
jgi:hypothetical protein